MSRTLTARAPFDLSNHSENSKPFQPFQSGSSTLGGPGQLFKHSNTSRMMPDGIYPSDRYTQFEHDSFSTTTPSVGMNYSTESRPPPPPGIFPSASSSSRSAAPNGPPGLARDQVGPSASFSFHSSPPLAHANQNPLTAPRAMPPFPRLTSPQPMGEQTMGGSSGARSPSPTKRSFNFPIGDPSERWNSIAQVSSNASRGPTANSQRKASIHSGLSAASSAAEPFLGYNELFSPNGTHLSTSEASKSANAAALSTSDPMNVAFRSGSSGDSRGFSLSSSQEQDLISHRFGLSPGHYATGGRDEISQTGGNPRSLGHDDFTVRLPYGPGSAHGLAGAGPGMLGVPNAGNLSPRTMMQLQHQHMQMQSQLLHQQQPPSHPSHLGQQQQQQQQSQLPPSQQQQLGLQSSIGNSASLMTPGGLAEEITTVFIVGFPDDMTEREFANMFLFSKGFEASTLKIPPGLGQLGPNGRATDGSGPLSAGPGGPYQAVNLQGSGAFDLGGNAGAGWEDQNLPLGLRGPGGSDAFSSLASMAGMQSALGGGGLGAANASAAAAGKIKQIIGFAKFRTRAEALEARDALNGRKVDAEKGCVLKTEMAKKNLHTKQRPVLSAPGYPESSNGPMLSPVNAGPGGISSGHPSQPPFALGGPFDTRAGPQMNGPGGQVGPFGPFGKAPAGFESFSGQAPLQGNGAPSTSADLLSPQEMFGGPDFFGQGGPSSLRASNGGPVGLDQQGRPLISSQQSQSQQSQSQQSQSQQSQSQQQQQQQDAASVDKWGGSMGPIDYYGPGPDSGAAPIVAPSRGPQGQSLHAQAGSRPDWPAVGSPPPGLFGQPGSANMTGQAPRPTFARQGSGGSSAVGIHGVEQGALIGNTGRPEDSIKAERHASSTPSSTDPESVDIQQQLQQQQQPSAITTRFGSLSLGSPSNEDEAGGVKPPQRIPSPDLPSPTGRNVLGDNHPPVNTLFVGNLPSNASSAVLSQIEDQLRAVFSSCRGFRQFSFRLKSNGPMCFVEFEDVHTAGKAISELNGHSLGGTIKNGGIRLSFSKNPLFRMNSNSAMNAIMSSGGALGSGSSAGSAPTPENVAGGGNVQMSLGSASESIAATARR